MYKFSSVTEIPLPGGGMIVLRKPTAKERDYFQDEVYHNRDATPNVSRTEYFDLLFISISECEDDNGKLAPEDKVRIPEDIKMDVILKRVEPLDADNIIQSKN